MRVIYRWTMEKAKSEYAVYWLACISFIESVVFPIPPDLLQIAMSVGRPERSRYYAKISAAASVCGGAFGYLVGFLFFDTFGQKIVDFYHLGAQIEHVRILFLNNTFISVFTAAFTPVPYKVFTLAAWLFQVSFLTFMTASLLGRFGRFYIVALLTERYGSYVDTLIFKYVNAISIVLTLILIGGYFFLL